MNANIPTFAECFMTLLQCFMAGTGVFTALAIFICAVGFLGHLTNVVANVIIEGAKERASLAQHVADSGPFEEIELLQCPNKSMVTIELTYKDGRKAVKSVPLPLWIRRYE